ncbi:hypothetical protein SO802_015058 [Lithocarpus litseifolius]|uniref:Endonuclease/exonuclease/phosphatase domain-containing protein n=1 Tax=Lithocarpus litseifolius TaxID=425828 RepID=A0AAW2CUX9_9ROSI
MQENVRSFMEEKLKNERPGCGTTPAEHNESIKLELLRAWEPLDSSRPSQTCFYGWPEASQKHKSWALLSHLATLVEGPWCCIGDFNAILLFSEKQSKHQPPYKQTKDFSLALESCRLADMGFHGYPFTRNNKRSGDANTKESLDRVVANSEWRERFPASTLTHLFSHALDHAPLVLQTMIDHGLRGRRANGFKFEEAWLLWDDCERMVADSWTVRQTRAGSAMSMIKSKIENYGVELHA